MLDDDRAYLLEKLARLKDELRRAKRRRAIGLWIQWIGLVMMASALLWRYLESGR